MPLAPLPAKRRSSDPIEIGVPKAMVLRIERTTDRGPVVFTLSGRVEVEHVAELQTAFEAEERRIALDLKGVRLVDRDVVPYLARWEAEGVTLENCPAYLRDWISREGSRR